MSRVPTTRAASFTEELGARCATRNLTLSIGRMEPGGARCASSRWLPTPYRLSRQRAHFLSAARLHLNQRPQTPRLPHHPVLSGPLDRSRSIIERKKAISAPVTPKYVTPGAFPASPPLLLLSMRCAADGCPESLWRQTQRPLPPPAQVAKTRKASFLSGHRQPAETRNGTHPEKLLDFASRTNVTAAATFRAAA